MTFKRNMIFSLLLVMILPVISLAQTDAFGKIDTMYCDVAKIDDQHWSVTVSYTNDEDIVGLSIPLKLDAGMTKVVGDSAVYIGGRVEHFAYKGFRADTAVQCVTLGMVANLLGPTQNKLTAGNGRLATFFVSALEGDKIVKLNVDSTETKPSNTLLTVADRIQKMGDKVDTITLERKKELEITPVFVVRQSK